MSEAPILFEVEDGVGIISFNVPDRLNAFSDAMHDVIQDVAVAAEQDERVRVVVLTGKGRAFCAGADMDRLNRLIEGRGTNYEIPRQGIVPERMKAIDAPAELNSIYSFPLALSKPVIGAVNGPAVGAGFVMAVNCDMRFASSKAFFNAAFGARGLIAEAGLAWSLPRLVGLGHAADILYSGRRIGAEEAQAMGLVNRVLEPDALIGFVMDYAREMAATVAPRSLRLMKRQLQRSATQSFGESAGEAHDLLVEALAHDDFLEGVRSFQEKRAPRFTGR
ncbi:enoyl-CoA hydratase-related protein [Sphingobium sp. Sx8-8]|uniref:enoyl-CoA hydratase-related protein n=1 Tax=Sphingobium sp. Sx8-8 TaxID=2933617 RepID=UPI001F5AD5D9|nr:enoyl-CoA hydratase-related protein [Sphingobium sp. Sx8-8]